MGNELITPLQRLKLELNGFEQKRQRLRGVDVRPNFIPVLKLFTPEADCIWLLTEIYPDDPDMAFGLGDLGLGFPEPGDVRLSELADYWEDECPLVECDDSFRADKTLGEYYREALQARRILA